jgi:WS/DGAT/MGAT family acyltransferase
MGARERISGVDTAWLRMEQPNNLMMIVGILMFRGALDVARVRDIISTRFMGYRRFRQKAVHDAAGAWWEEDDDFNIANHVHRIALPSPGGKDELEALVSDLACTPLDFSKPLWQFHVVEGYEGGSALITRIHHCYADGIALIQVMLSMTAPSAKQSLALPGGEQMPANASSEADFWEQVLKPVSGALANLGGAASGAMKLAQGITEQGREILSNPQAVVAQVSGVATEVAGKGVEFAREVAKLALMGRDSQTRFKGDLGVRKRCVWADPLPLPEVKVMGKALNASINDVLVAMAAAALREYLADCGDPVDAVNMRAVIPVNLRPLEQGKNLGNHFGLVFLDLPVGVAHPLQRVFEVKSRMQALKGSYQPVIALGLLSVVGYGPKVLQDQVGGLLSQNASTVLTNVPGPQQPLYFAGLEIVEQNFWVPQSGAIGMGISILSYNNRIQFGVITDEGLIPNPELIVAHFRAEYERLMWLTLMSPWGDEWNLLGEVPPATAGGTKSRKRLRRS